ncbi:MFS transporter [Flavilitoribacter nigricans]|uniref:MFS transporter n=1 Tax=Flavilitoribacter nigricans (strain ATCC 23147 / DSM 23189 / NBRC 102662 / NCIMB 1420 / SS-2) TaxID=1122177 RepID=A0A2D0N156_FLAN2|nr:MFS transporter [Flavilitoribacter nigricans]PHN02118.1 MFS transporter [Flavilitoribacter nigricans DSM 23189 = NBRC 102662]
MKARHLVAVGMFLLALLLYIDRICISVAKDPIADALSLSDKAMGWVLSAFALGYALFQVPSGMLADRYGPRRVLSGIVGIWSVVTALTGAAWNFLSLVIIRFIFGAGEAGAFPGMSRAIYSWFPLRERGLVTGINFSGSRLGAAFALPFVAWMIESYTWRTTFFILGGIGLVWALLWWYFFRDTPEEQIGINEEEKAYIIANRQTETDTVAGKPPGRQELLSSKNMQSAIVQYFASNFTFFFALTWLFPYIKSTYELDAMQAGWYSVAPFVAGAAGNWLGGGAVDAIFKKGNWNASRNLPAMVGFALAAVGLIGSIFMTTPLGAIFMISIAIFGADMTLPPSWALCVDIGKKHAGMVSGTMNMAGNIGSFLTALAFPYLTAWMGSTDYFFYTAAALNGIAIWMWWRVKAERGLAY